MKSALQFVTCFFLNGLLCGALVEVTGGRFVLAIVVIFFVLHFVSLGIVSLADGKGLPFAKAIAMGAKAGASWFVIWVAGLAALTAVAGILSVLG